MRSYGETLRELRQKAGLSQKEEADLLRELGIHVNNAHISRWENGFNNPSIEQFIAICKLYGIRNVHDAFGEGELLGLTRDLNPEGVKRLMEFREILLKDPRYEPRLAETDKREEIDPSAKAQGKAMAKEFAAAAAEQAAREHASASASPVRKRLYSLGHADVIAADEYVMVDGPPFLPESASYAVVVSGDAMYPDLRSGDRAWIEETSEIGEQDIALVRLNGALYLRRVHRDSDVIELVSANEEYRTMRARKEDSFQILGRVLRLAGDGRPALFNYDELMAQNG